MRLNLHDFSGHPFQVQLSRELARRGHHVVHEYSTQYVTGHGRLAVTDADPDTLRIQGLTCNAPMVKYSPIGRMRFEARYAEAWKRSLDGADYDLVVACNVPMFALARMRAYFAKQRQPWVLWHQDLYSLGVGAEAARRLPEPLARPARSRIERVEQAQVRSADAVVAITEAMTDQYAAWGIRRDKVYVQRNWAPLDDITPTSRENAWSREHSLPENSLRLLYAGTLGRKHNPLLLLEILDALRARGVEAHLVVASEGDGADELAARAGDRPDVQLVGFQPAESFADMLGSSDVVLALLEPDAARFSVPSKVHSYLSAGRPIVALVPDGNPAAQDVTEAGGFVAPPTGEGAAAAADWLVEASGHAGRLAGIGRASRALAESRFDIAAIGDTFEVAFTDAIGAARGTTKPAAGDARRPRTMDGVGR